MVSTTSQLGGKFHWGEKKRERERRKEKSTRKVSEVKKMRLKESIPRGLQILFPVPVAIYRSIFTMSSFF